MARDWETTLGYLFGEISVRAYAEEYFPPSMFLWLRSHCPDLADFLRQLLIESIVDLDALPRTDPSWAGTNNRATIFKVYEPTERIPIDRVTPKDAWQWIAVQYYYGNLADIKYWRILRNAGELRLYWLVALITALARERGEEFSIPEWAKGLGMENEVRDYLKQHPLPPDDLDTDPA